MTNAHVVENLRNITVVLYDGTMLPGTVVASDEKADVALVKVNKLGLAPITFAQDSPVAGKTAMVIGTPVSMSMRGSVTAGIVSGTDVTLADSYYKLLQTDAAINPGNSGGAIINAKGELIGLASSKFVNVQIESICFGIPADTVRYVLDCFDAFGGVVYPDFGVTLEQSFEAEIGLPTAKGLTVTKAPAGGTLAAGDVIHTVGGHSVSSLADFHEAVRKTYMGVPLAITYRKGGENGEEVAGTLAAIVK